MQTSFTKLWRAKYFCFATGTSHPQPPKPASIFLTCVLEDAIMEREKLSHPRETQES